MINELITYLVFLIFFPGYLAHFLLMRILDYKGALVLVTNTVAFAILVLSSGSSSAIISLIFASLILLLGLLMDSRPDDYLWIVYAVFFNIVLSTGILWINRYWLVILGGVILLFIINTPFHSDSVEGYLIFSITWFYSLPLIGYLWAGSWWFLVLSLLIPIIELFVYRPLRRIIYSGITLQNKLFDRYVSINGVIVFTYLAIIFLTAW